MNAKLENLVDFWKYARERGIQLTFDDLCRDCPELRDEVRAKLQELSALSTDDASAETKAFQEPIPVENTPSQPPSKGGEANLVAETRDTQPLIPGYRIVRELGRGGMGVVYLATDLALQRPVAIKMGLTQTKASIQSRFQNEAAALARLQHSHIVPVYAAGTTQSGQTYFVMEFVADGSLADRIGKTPQSINDSARLVQLLAKAVHAAHQRGIIHRDLKPANVLLAPPADEPALNCVWGCPKIADFGVVKILDNLSGDQAVTNTGDVLGTPSYMAPEQARSGKSIGPAVDIYALGAILYSLLAGQPPFHGGTSIDVILRVLEEPPTPLREVRPEIPKALAAVCHKCLEKKPAARFESAAVLAEALDKFLKGESGTHPIKPTGIATQKHEIASTLPTSKALPKQPVFVTPINADKHATKYRVQCPLGHLLEIGSENIGQRMMCPICEAVIHTSPARPGESPGTKYEVQCDQGHILRVKQKYLGKEILCPSCQQMVSMKPGMMLTTSGVMLSVARPELFKVISKPKQ